METIEKTFLTPEELKEFKDTLIEHQAEVHGLGLISLDLEYLKAEKNRVVEIIKQIEAKKVEIGQKLTEKYGNTTVDIETGELTPVL
jgi:hypothetical protein